MVFREMPEAKQPFPFTATAAMEPAAPVKTPSSLLRPRVAEANLAFRMEAQLISHSGLMPAKAASPSTAKLETNAQQTKAVCKEAPRVRKSTAKGTAT